MGMAAMSVRRGISQACKKKHLPPMNPLSILMLGMAMSTDAFAAALARGANTLKPRLSHALLVGLIFGTVETITPIIGWLIGSFASDLIADYDHWAAFLLLTGLGLHAIYSAIRKSDETGSDGANGASEPLLATALTGLATSIDAMAVGVGLAFANVNIAAVALVIGLCTFVMVTLGVLAGKAVGMVLGRHAEIAGGCILIGVGAMLLYQHLK